MTRSPVSARRLPRVTASPRLVARHRSLLGWPARAHARRARRRARPTRPPSSGASSRPCASSPTASRRTTRLGEFYIQRGALADAIPHLERARTIDPAHYANGYDLAARLPRDRARSTTRASRCGGCSRRRRPASCSTCSGDVEARAGDYVAAAVGYQRAAHLAADRRAPVRLGRQPAAACAPTTTPSTCSRQPSAAIPTSARLHIGLGIAQYSRGRYEEAVASFCARRRPGARRSAARTVPRRDVRRVARRRATRSPSGCARFVELQARETRSGTTTTR